MKVLISKKAFRFVNSLNDPYLKYIKSKIQYLKTSLEDTDISSLNNIDIKILHGELHGYYRIRFGKFRLICIISHDNLTIETIDFRGNIY
jgi:mRNA interferase RelE/StbE